MQYINLIRAKLPIQHGYAGDVNGQSVPVERSISNSRRLRRMTTSGSENRYRDIQFELL